MGAIVNAYKRLPEHTTVPDAAYEIDALIEESDSLRKRLHEIDNQIFEKQRTYHTYLRQHWTQGEILEAQKE